MPFSGCFQSNCWWRFFALAAILLLRNISVKGTDTINTAQKIESPHVNVMLCTSCHLSVSGGKNTLKFSNISRLCQSCHDGHQATREVHPVDIIPNPEILGRLPTDFPLEEGKITCLTCHDVSQKCTTKLPGMSLGSFFLRRDIQANPLEFCFYCHKETNYQSFNVHNQIEADKVNPDVCLWCHLNTPDTNSLLQDTPASILRGDASHICDNCHSAVINNPEDETHDHMYLIPSNEMKWYISAYEIQPQMNLPVEQLIEYVRAANRIPRTIPLDKNGRITCWSCHNPHEKGLLPNWNPRSIGAEPDKSTNHRLRARRADISCRVCHQK